MGEKKKKVTMLGHYLYTTHVLGVTMISVTKQEAKGERTRLGVCDVTKRRQCHYFLTRWSLLDQVHCSSQ